MNDRLSEKVLAYVTKKMAGNATARKGRLIVIEGLDGTGKTTATIDLARRINGIALNSPISEIHREARARIDALALANPLEHFRFYNSANIDDSAQVLSPVMDRGDIVVLDRYELTTLVGHAAFGIDLDGEIDAIQDPEKIISADITIFLRLETKERIRRIMRRGQNQANSQFDIDFEYQKRMESMYDQLIQRGLIEVDINGLDVSGVTEKLVETLVAKRILK